MKHRIVILTKGYARYRENLVTCLANSLPRQYEVIHSTYAVKEDLWEVDWDALLQDDGRVTHVHMPEVGLRSYFSAIRQRFSKPKNPMATPQKDARIEALVPDMIIIQEYSVSMLKMALYCVIRGIPCIVCSDLGKDSDWSQFPRLIPLIHSLGAFLTSGVVAHTEAARKPLNPHGRPVIFIPHSIDIRSMPFEARTASEGQVSMLMVAQYIPRKGHDLLADAVSELKSRGVTGFEIRLVGTQDPQWVNSVISNCGLGDTMKVLGVLKGEDLFREFREADLFVLTSRFDTYAVVVHEAAAFGLPLVISRFAASASLMVEEGRNGFTVNPHDAMELADRLGKIIEEPDLRASMGRASRLNAEELCASKLGKKLADWLVDNFPAPYNTPPPI